MSLRDSSSHPNLALGEGLLVSSLAGDSPSSAAGEIEVSTSTLRPLRVAQLQLEAGGNLSPHTWRSGGSSRARSEGGAGWPWADGADLLLGVRAAFAALDADGDGVLGEADLRLLCGRLGLGPLTDEEASALTADLARPGAAGADAEQFAAMLLPPARQGAAAAAWRAGGGSGSFTPGSATAELDAAFALFDDDNDGFVSLADARAVLRRAHAPHAALPALIAAADADGDGRLSRAEFAALVTQL